MRRRGGSLHGARYYGFLATTLPTATLGEAVLRRARRRMVRGLRVIAPEPPLSTRDLLSSLGLKRLDDLAERLRIHPAGRGPLEPHERSAARALVQEHLPWLPGEVCRRADRILAGELHLFGQWREHARGELEPGIAAFDLLRDPLHGGRAQEVPSHEIDVLAAGVDTRALWEAARLSHVLTLAQAHALAGLNGTSGTRGSPSTGGISGAPSGNAPSAGIYARAAVLHVRDFIATQPRGFGPHWTCPMEAGLRAIHLSLALSLLRDAPELDAPFWADALVCLWEHARFIEDELEDTQAVPANHLLSDLAGLIVIGSLFPEIPGAWSWRSDAIERFGAELLRQSTADGLSFESSTAYHRFVVELGLVTQSVARRQGLSLARPALDRLWLMCRFAEGAVLPDGLLPRVGDDDGSRGAMLHPRHSLETSHLGSLRVALGGPGAGGCSLEPESLWLGGTAGFRRAWLACRDGRRRRALEVAGGLAVMRADGGRGVSLWAGANGQMGLGGHAHNDKLACEIVLGGKRVVVDPGSPVYSHAPEERDRYRSTAMHPTVQLDGLEQSPIFPGRPFLLPETAQARLEFAEAGRLRGEHEAWLRFDPGVLHKREVFLPADAPVVAVVDRLTGSGAHLVELRWPLTSRDVMLRSANQAEREALAALEGRPFLDEPVDVTKVFALGPEDAPFALLAIAADVKWEGRLTESCWSPGYGERISGRTVLVRMHAQVPLSVTSVFVMLDRSGPGSNLIGK